MHLTPFTNETPAPDDSAPALVIDLLGFLGVVGQKLLWIAIIIVSCVAAAFVLRIVIRRVVKRIVDSAKTKANVENTQALERSRSPICAWCSAHARSARSCRTS